jgi:hypothetical protein
MLAGISVIAAAQPATTPGHSGACAGMSLGVGGALNGYLPFPANNPWNMDISNAPIDPNSNNIINFIGPTLPLQADFSMPYTIVSASQPELPVNLGIYGFVGDPGPMPVPPNAPIEAGGTDMHTIVVDKDSCWSYELYGAAYANGQWNVSTAAVFDLTANEYRPFGWASANAGGTSIFAGILKYDEMASGEIRHAIRFVVPTTRQAFTPPGNNFTNLTTDPNAPPMGMRLRLKASVDVSGYPPQSQTILKALQKYGMIVDDNGCCSLFINGGVDSRWDYANDLYTLKQVHASDFEVMYMNPVYTASDIPTGPAPAIHNFHANPATVSKGKPVTLSWSITNSEYTIVTPAVGTTRATRVVVMPQASTTYTLTSTNHYGRTTATVTVTVR